MLAGVHRTEEVTDNDEVEPALTSDTERACIVGSTDDINRGHGRAIAIAGACVCRNTAVIARSQR